MKIVLILQLLLLTSFLSTSVSAESIKPAPSGATKEKVAIINLTTAEAKTKSKEYFATNFKGYKIDDISERIDNKGRKTFKISTTDAGGNKFYFRLNYRHEFKGPFLIK